MQAREVTESMHAGANMFSSLAFKCSPLMLLPTSFKFGQTSVGKPVQTFFLSDLPTEK